MVKTYYKKELAISQTCAVGSKGNDVSKCQEWLSLFEFVNPGSGTALTARETRVSNGIGAWDLCRASLIKRHQLSAKIFGA